MEAKRKTTGAFEIFKYTVLALLPILSIYDGISFINLGELLLLGIMALEILMHKGRFDINADLFIVIMFLAVLNIITGIINMNIINFNGYLNNSIDMIQFAVICAYFVKSTIVKKDVVYKYLKVVALISSFFLVVQYVFFIKGIVLYGFFPFLGTGEFTRYDVISISYGRPNSFFMEPAHFSIYVLPVYAIALLKSQYITSLILLAAIFLSTSSTGIITAVVITLMFVAGGKKIPNIAKCILIIVGAVIIILSIPYIGEIGESNFFEKISFYNLKKNIRVFGSLKYFTYFDVKELIFGVGINQITNYMRIFANLNVRNYSNAFFFSFLSFGVLGGTIWTSYIINLFKLSKNKILYIVFICIYLSDQILFNRNLFYLLMILFIFSDNEEHLDRIQAYGEITKKT